MKDENKNYECDFCGGIVGQFNPVTGNHVSCEQGAEWKRKNAQDASALRDKLTERDRQVEQLQSEVKIVRDYLEDARAELKRVRAELTIIQHHAYEAMKDQP